MCTHQLISRKTITFFCACFLLFNFSLTAKAQNGDVAPKKSSEQVVTEYRNTHNSNNATNSTINISVPTKKDAEIILTQAKGADLTNDQYYSKIIDDRNAEYTRNGILPPDRDQWLSLIARLEADEWPAKFPDSYHFDSGYATVQHHGRFGVIDKKGKIIIPIIWKWAGTFMSGLSMVQSIGPDSRTGFMNVANQLVIPLKYENCTLGFKDGIAGVKLNGKWGYIDPNDRIILPFIYDEVKIFYNDLGIVKQKNKYGVVDKNGNLIIPVKYSWITQLTSEKMFVVELKDKWGAFDEKGGIITEPIYAHSFSYTNDKAKVTLKSRTFYIDKKGIEVSAP